MNDYVLRGYTKCPAYQRRLEAWFGSPEFKAKEEETREFRESIAASAPKVNASLANWWNGGRPRGAFDGASPHSPAGVPVVLFLPER